MVYREIVFIDYVARERDCIKDLSLSRPNRKDVLYCCYW